MLQIKVNTVGDDSYTIKKYNGYFGGVETAGQFSGDELVELCNRHNIEILNKEELPIEVQEKLE